MLDGLDAALAAAGIPPLPRTAWLAIDVDALAANLAAIRASVPAGTRVEPVVKADAYGHGAVPVARVLQAAGADGFGVATFDEALELRDGGVTAPILVLYPVPPGLAADAAARDIAVTAGDGVLLERLLAARRSTRGGVLAIQLEVETGLGRGGIAVEAIAAAARTVAATPGTRLAGVWSHLQDPTDRDRSDRQAGRLAAAAEALAAAGFGLPVHLSASGALVLGATGGSVVRPGLITYGVVPDDLAGASALPGAAGDPGLAARLRPVMTIAARPVRVTELASGHGVSYGPSFVTARPSRIASLPIGYGDGWARAHSDDAEALVRGVRVPLVGRVAMDAVMADVTDVPGAPVTVDDTFVLLGEQRGARIEAAELARRRTTISWEVVTAMSRRMPRVYHSAGVVTGVRTLVGGRTE